MTMGVIGIGMPGNMEMMILLGIVLIIFGPKQLPKLAKTLGRSIKDFKSGLNSVQSDLEAELDEEERQASEASEASEAKAETPAIEAKAETLAQDPIQRAKAEKETTGNAAE